MDLLDEDAYLYNPYTATPVSDHEDEDDDGPEEEALHAGRAEPSSSNMFALHNTGWKAKHYGGARIKHLVSASGTLYAATDRGRVVRWNLHTGDEQEIVVEKGGHDVIFKLHIDQGGNHLFIGGNQGENWYVQLSKGLKPRLMAMAKGARLESVCWDRDGTDDISTGEVLVGTSTGTICKACVVDGKDKFWKEIYSLQDSAQPICGLDYELFPPSGKNILESTRKYFVMAATPTRYYEFIGGTTYDALFAQYTAAPNFVELPGELDFTELRFYRKGSGRATSFVWLTGPGIYSGSFSFGSQNAGDSVTFDYKLLPYQHGGGAVPVGLHSTEFHWFALFEDSIQAINRLTQELVWEHSFSSGHVYGEMRGMTHDPATGRFWVYSGALVNEVQITGEDQHVWKCYLARGKYDTALQYCQNLEQRERVLTAQADHYFQEGQWELAATIYAKTKRSFEEVTLKFINLGEKDALKRYLSDKLDNIRSSDRAQLTMICTWLSEMYLDKLNSVKGGGSERGATGGGGATTADASYGHLLDEFKHFLQDNLNNVDTETTYQLIMNHGRMDVMLYFAELNADYDRLITHHIQRREWTKALDVLAKTPDPELFYKHSPILMQHAPVGTTNAWINSSKVNPTMLDPRKLIPALVRYNVANNPPGHKANQAIRFLQHCIKNLKNLDPVLVNYLAGLYAKQEDETALLAFLAEFGGGGGPLDLDYTMRVCAAEGKKEACVRIYTSLGQFEQAVDAALDLRDIELAKLNADKAEDNDELRKKLWLRIARYVIEEEGDVRKAIAFIGQTEMLKVEDILPYFPDFTLIDDFKDAICKSLEDYHRHIEDLTRGMEEATKSSELIRRDVAELRGRFGFVRSGQQCGFCRVPALAAALYLFPCQHAFHMTCLEQWMVKEHLTGTDKKRARELKSQIESEEKALARGNVSEERRVAAERFQLELDDLLASECPLCGQPAIDLIAKPLPAYGSGPAEWEIPATNKFSR